VIPVLNERDNLPAALDAIGAQRNAPVYEVLVVDNGSTDGTRQLAAAHPRVTQVLLERERGPYAARNAGIAAARGEVVVLTDADCRAEPDWLHAGMRAIEDGADLVGGAIVQDRDPSASVWARYDRATYLRQEQFVLEQRFAATANLFVRAAVFSHVGVFRPELVASGDLEFGHRATAAGHRLVYASDARVAHRPRATLRDTWHLHRKLGSGFAELARAGLREKPWSDPALREPLSVALWLVSEDGGYVPRRKLLPVHTLAMTARWVGRLTGRG